MMPTFPLSPLSFRTAGFPQYGWKAGISDSAFPVHPSLKPAPGIRRWTPGLHLPFAHLIVRFGCPVLCRAADSSMRRLGVGVRLRPKGSRSDPGSSVPGHQRLFSPIRLTREHIAFSPTMRLIRDAFAVRECLSDPPSGSEFLLLIPSRHAVLYALGEIEIRFIQITDFDMGLRLVLRGSALPGILPSASSRARFRGFLVRISLRPVQLLASLDGSDQDFSQPQRLLHPGFPRVSHLSRCWISLRQSLECSVGGTFTH